MYADADKDKNISIMLIPRDKAILLWAEICALECKYKNFKDLKEALVRSPAKRDRPLPPWVASLDYQRPSHFYDLTPLKKTETRDDSPLPAPSPVPSPSIDVHEPVLR